jgi:hypothetical protein
MKKLSLLLLVIAAATSSFAKTGDKDITKVKKITTTEVVTSLKIYKDVEVVLTDDSLNEIQIVGEDTDVEKVSVKVNNGELIISGASDGYFRNKVVVYVPSKNLADVYIHGASTLSSSVILPNDMLDITINGEGKSMVSTTGKINVNTVRDFPRE